MAALVLAAGPLAAAETQKEEKAQNDGEWLSRGQTVALLHAGGVAAIITYGLLNWDYGEDRFNFRKEHWFQRDTEDGGMDKIGHFWSSYALSHLLAYGYRHLGYTSGEANLYGAASSLGLQTVMELADGFSNFGVSYEDLLMNVLGAGVGYLWGRYPDLKRKIDFRMEYIPGFDSDDLDPFTNYEQQKYLVALKADGFDLLRQPVIEYLELHAGYYTRNYEGHRENREDDRQRYGFVGLGINVTKIVKNFFDITVFDYIQVPYTSINLEYRFDDR
jgi:hypothetical protein